MTIKLNRVYHHVDLWEEIPANMWGEATNAKEALRQAIAFTGDPKEYGRYMMRVIEEWPYSCENAMTDDNLNKKAWVGHAACALALNIPEDITRKAWGYLTYEQQKLANWEADRAIRTWTLRYLKGRKILPAVDGSGLFEWGA